MARKVFEFTPVPDAAPEFEVGGEVFVCQSTEEVSSLDVLDHITALSSGTGVQRIQGMIRLFNAFIADDDVERFRKTVKERKVPLPVLNDIASWALDEYLAFPTREDGQSSNGSAPAVPPNAAVSSPPPDETSTS